MLKVIDDGDDKYREWCENNSNGFVANCRRGASQNYFVLHKPICSHISSYGGAYPAGKYTERQYIKICSSDIDEIVRWGVTNKHIQEPSYCSTCWEEGYPRRSGGRPADTVPPDSDWSDAEFESAVNAYLGMLDEEIAGRRYSKAEVNRSLRSGALSSRTKASVEYRMQNISAALQDLGMPWIKGYLPAKNLGPRGRERIEAFLAAKGAYSPADYTPSANPEELDQKVRKLRKRNLTGIPQGVMTPKQTTAQTTVYARDPRVKAWVLDNANGDCEGCGTLAPFKDKYGYHFLEVHHVVMLGDGGPDTIENAVALCPNCHRRCHVSGDRKEFSEGFYQKLGRLVRG